MTRDTNHRRDFLKLAVASAVILPARRGSADRPPPQPTPPPPRKAPSPDAAPPTNKDLGAVTDAGSDFMVDVIKSLGVDYIAANPADSIRGIHESLIHYGGNRRPEWLTCLHEEIAVAMAHGYFKIAGKPLIAMMHGTVGIQHASMAIYNAWCDRVPVIVIGGNDLDESSPARGKEIVSAHSAQDPNTMVRDFTKWDDTPVSLQHFANSFVRGYKIAMTPPYGPVMLTVDASYQQEPNRERARLTIPPYKPTSPPQGEAGAVREAARLLVAAETPLIVVDRAARDQRGVELLVELAELIGAPVVDLRGRMNFPNTHELCRHLEDAAPLVSRADVVLGLELANFWGAVNSFVDNNVEGKGVVNTLVRRGTKLISISSITLIEKANFQDFQRFQPVDLELAADAQATLPSLIESVKAALTAPRKRAVEARRRALRDHSQKLRDAVLADAKRDWQASPLATARVTMDLFEQIKGLDWSLVGGSRNMVKWARRLWPLHKHFHYIGLSGGYGMGYELPSAVGAALANRDSGRISVNLQSDGAMMYTPQALWTLAHHKIPMLTVMMNNRAYHAEVEHLTKVSGWRSRKPPTGALIGTALDGPAIDFAKLAQSMGVFAVGPITKPGELEPALKKALAVVRSGAPALVDVVTQPR